MKSWKLLVCATATLALVGCDNMAKKPEPKPAPPVTYVKPVPKPVVQVSGFFPGAPRRNGLTDAHISFKNVSDQTLQFVMFKTTAYDSDGKVVEAKKTHRQHAWLRVAGPFGPYADAGEHTWNKIWQSRKTACFEVEGVQIIYMDGANEYYNASRLGDILTDGATNHCKKPDLAQRQ